MDIFDNTILCKKCNKAMKNIEIIRNGLRMRAVQCPTCQERIIHPSDLVEYNQYMGLKNKVFRVKMRIVGNSYAVSIPREIVNFMQEQEKIMDDMVRLCFNDAKRISLTFGQEKTEKEQEVEEEND